MGGAGTLVTGLQGAVLGANAVASMNNMSVLTVDADSDSFEEVYVSRSSIHIICRASSDGPKS